MYLLWPIAFFNYDHDFNDKHNAKIVSAPKEDSSTIWDELCQSSVKVPY